MIVGGEIHFCEWKNRMINQVSGQNFLRILTDRTHKRKYKHSQINYFSTKKLMPLDYKNYSLKFEQNQQKKKKIKRLRHEQDIVFFLGDTFNSNKFKISIFDFQDILLRYETILNSMSDNKNDIHKLQI